MAPPSGRTAVTTSEAAGHEAHAPGEGLSMARGSETAYAMLQDTASTLNARPRRKQTRKLPSDDLPTEAAVLKRRIWASHPGSVYKFRLDKMKRVVTPPVEIPPPQRDLFKTKRLLGRIREGIAY
ncbi:hypothetical protein GQ600_16546 [Phytophthora cactorum]|nr:hypothetical protein GQ600_16546 [Phytophthora cactorum]